MASKINFYWSKYCYDFNILLKNGDIYRQLGSENYQLAVAPGW